MSDIPFPRKVLIVGGAAAVLFAATGTLRSAEVPKDAPDQTVALCDGQSTMTIAGLKPGEVLSPERASVVGGGADLPRAVALPPSAHCLNEAQ